MRQDDTDTLIAEAEKELMKESGKGLSPKIMFKPFVLVFIPHLFLWLYLGKAADILLGIAWAAILSALLVGYCYTVFILIDSEKWYYNLIAILLTGLLGIAILLGLRGIYRKLSFTFLE